MCVGGFAIEVENVCWVRTIGRMQEGRMQEGRLSAISRNYGEIACILLARQIVREIAENRHFVREKKGECALFPLSVCEIPGRRALWRGPRNDDNGNKSGGLGLGSPIYFFA